MQTVARLRVSNIEQSASHLCYRRRATSTAGRIEQLEIFWSAHHGRVAAHGYHLLFSQGNHHQHPQRPGLHGVRGNELDSYRKDKSILFESFHLSEDCSPPRYGGRIFLPMEATSESEQNSASKTGIYNPAQSHICKRTLLKKKICNNHFYYFFFWPCSRS